MRRLTVSLLVAGCVIAAAGCGGGGTKTVGADAYAGSVCKALGTWQQHLGEASAILAQKTNTATSLRRVRAQFVAFFGGAIVETDKMLAAVADAGVPDVNDGDKVATGMVQALRRFRPILVAARAKARRLPVGNEERFTTKAQTLGATFRAEAADLGAIWETLGKRYSAPELARAANADAACTRL